MSKTKSLRLLRGWDITLILLALFFKVLIHCNHKRSENCLKWSNFGRLILNFGYANVRAIRNMSQEHFVYNYNACPAQRSPQYSTVQYTTVLWAIRLPACHYVFKTSSLGPIWQRTFSGGASSHPHIQNWSFVGLTQ